MTENMSAGINMTSMEMLTAYTEWLDKQGHIVKGWGTDGRLNELASEFVKNTFGCSQVEMHQVRIPVMKSGPAPRGDMRRPTITPTQTDRIPNHQPRRPTITQVKIEDAVWNDGDQEPTLRKRSVAAERIEIEGTSELVFPAWPEDFGWERSASGEWGRTSTLDAPTRMGRLLCRLGYHKWEQWKKATNLDDGLYYLMCKRCGAS